MTFGKVAVAPTRAAPTWQAIAGMWGSNLKRSYDLKQLFNLLPALELCRPVITLEDHEHELLLAQFARYCANLNQQGVDRWARFLALFIFQDGNCRLRARPPYEGNPHLAPAVALLKSFVGNHLPTYEQLVAESAREVAPRPLAVAAPVPAPVVLSTGAQWLNDGDLRTSPLYTNTMTGRGLLLGTLKDTRTTVFFPGNQSLITIGGAGTGKTQAHVVTNLLNYKGSAFVLDVKDQLWKMTAGWRSHHCGPCYRFAPTDPAQRSHRYNPLDLIPTDPTLAANQCRVLAHQIVSEVHSGEKYWSDRARDYVWAFAMLVALTHPAATRTITAIGQYTTLPTGYDSATSVAYLKSPTIKVMDALRALSQRTGISGLQDAATAFENALGDPGRLESIMDTARQSLSAFVGSVTAAQAMQRSDWHPLDLRRRPGTTVYISVQPDDLNAFAPLIRVLFQQHAMALATGYVAKPTDLPITFFLDEAPQLGAMSALTNILDLGREAGVRVWMFAQYYGQFKNAYRDLTDGLLAGCGLTCWMRPDQDGVEFIKPALGEKSGFLKRDKQPLATPADLRGRAFSDDIIVITPGEHPMRLNKALAHQLLPTRMKLPPPAVPKLSSAGALVRVP
jgi:type IV secretion system protein VirD4